jgi:hypothetical protein
MTSEREMKERLEEMARAELAAAQAAAAEDLPAARAAAAEAVALADRCAGDRRDAEQAHHRAQAAMRAATQAAMNTDLDRATKEWAIKDQALKAAALRHEVADHRWMTSRGVRDSFNQRLAEIETVARGYPFALIKTASDWMAKTDLKGLVRRGALDSADADVIRRIAVGLPVLDGQRAFYEVAGKIVAAEAA